ncbi:unnamed protein product [Rotaria magnacalcarata]|uniref:Uncharacterized protein n=1 Tax=Rotaria magnacalcarata TaxID=392030 RepID=A0A8S2UP93_9BILA|nr:unnamed protein product [Rotaria magnacalcarata]
MLSASSRCLSLSSIPRANALAIIRQASSHSSKSKETVGVSTPTGSVEDPSQSPMSQRALPPDDGKVRFPNPWDVILNKRRFEYAMV